jgi:hypothetical protein
LFDARAGAGLGSSRRVRVVSWKDPCAKVFPDQGTMSHSRPLASGYVAVAVWLCALLAGGALACTRAKGTSGAAPPSSAAPAPTAAPAFAAGPAPASLFDFHVDFWVNVHQRLYAETSPRAPEPLAWEAADPVWQGALGFYRGEFPERGFLTIMENPRLVDCNRRLSVLGAGTDVRAAGVDAGLADVLSAAGAAYRREQWTPDMAVDDAWIQALEPDLVAHGEVMATALEQIYGARWERPLRVDVATFAGPVGAYTVLHPTHITVAAGNPRYQGLYALEMIFHEASHALVRGVQDRLTARIAASGKSEPAMLWHALIFFTAGEIVRKDIDPTYVPYADRNDLYERSPDWRHYREVLAAAWAPYVEGQGTLDAAIERVVAML